ncbi:MAG: hypothetical protein J6386_23400 [Candidatus Synoicihabitans palmerolidicus]|nr:hypothetical protein [Candidatus Synoicihabitans palmerolidicus]
MENRSVMMPGVFVVAGGLPQLWYAGVEVAYTDLLGSAVGPPTKDYVDQEDRGGYPGSHDNTNAAPCGVGALPPSRDAFAVVIGELHVGEQDRQEKKVGNDDDGDTERGGDSEFTDDFDLDGQHRHESHGVGDEGDSAWGEELTEGGTGGVEAGLAGEGFRPVGPHHLHAVAHADGKDEEWNEDRDRSQMR